MIALIMSSLMYNTLVLLVGLTGNYGMGKSTVLPLFEKLGAVVIDADQIVRSLLKKSSVLEKIRDLLGDQVFRKDGSLDTQRVADIIFRNAVLRRSLEDILHPLVFEEIDLFLKVIEAGDKIILIEVPLLFERGYEGRLDRAITVHTTEETALERADRKGLSREDALLRLKAQMPVKEKIRRSDFAIDNNGALEDTAAQVEKIFKELLREAKENGNNTGSGKLR